MPRLVKQKISFVASNEGYNRYGGKEFYPLKGINIYIFHVRTYAYKDFNLSLSAIGLSTLVVKLK